jgi:hypothetical protein
MDYVRIVAFATAHKRPLHGRHLLIEYLHACGFLLQSHFVTRAPCPTWSLRTLEIDCLFCCTLRVQPADSCRHQSSIVAHRRDCLNSPLLTSQIRGHRVCIMIMHHNSVATGCVHLWHLPISMRMYSFRMATRPCCGPEVARHPSSPAAPSVDTSRDTLQCPQREQACRQHFQVMESAHNLSEGHVNSVSA